MSLEEDNIPEELLEDEESEYGEVPEGTWEQDVPSAKIESAVKTEHNDDKKVIIEKNEVTDKTNDASFEKNVNLTQLESLLNGFLTEISNLLKNSSNISETSQKEVKSLSSIKKNIDELINKASDITVEHNKARESLDKVLGDFEEELKEMIHSIDTSFLLRSIQSKISEVTKNIPVAELNAGAKGITKSLEGLVLILSDSRKIIETSMKNQQELKENLDEGITKLSSTADVIKNTTSKINLKENYYLGIFITLSSLFLGLTIGFFSGISSSQNFIAVYLSELNKNITTYNIENKKTSKAFENYLDKFNKDSMGDYIVLDRKGSFLEEKNGTTIRYYFNKEGN